MTILNHILFVGDWLKAINGKTVTSSTLAKILQNITPPTTVIFLYLIVTFFTRFSDYIFLSRLRLLFRGLE